MLPALNYFALVFVVVYGLTTAHLLSYPRMWLATRVSVFWAAAIYCPVCAGTWVSLVLSWLWPFDPGWGWLSFLEPVAFSIVGLQLLASVRVLGNRAEAEAVFDIIREGSSS